MYNKSYYCNRLTVFRRWRMLNQFSRTQLLLGNESIKRLQNIRVADIYDTKVCPLARVMRYECRKRGVKSLKVVCSEEKPTRPPEDMSISCRTADRRRGRERPDDYENREELKEMSEIL